MASVRTGFTLSSDIYNDLAKISARLGISRSALVSIILSDSLNDLKQNLGSYRKPKRAEKTIRLRGDSADEVLTRVQNLQGVEDDCITDDI